MKFHASISLLLFKIIIGVLASNDDNSTESKPENLYVLNDDGKPIKLDLSIHNIDPNITDDDVQNFVSFLLYTRGNNNVSEQLFVDDINNLNESSFDPKKPTKFVTHGWMSSCQNDVCVGIREAFLQNGDYNVIEIDWNEISKKPYIWASSQIEKIARYVARMIDFLMSQGLNPSNVTLVGHSLGAHIAGLSSYYAKKKAYYVAALDPAGPIFNLLGPGGRVSKDDADYVEVIHTTKFIGLSIDLGDSDFYPNGGTLQSGCGVDLGESCSHSLAYKYFAESINNNRFLARKCDNFIDYKNGACDMNMVAYMGGVTPDFNARGRYYLITNPEPPYGRN